MNIKKLALGNVTAALAFTLLSSVTLAGTSNCTRIVVTGHPHYAPVSSDAGNTLQGGAISLVRRLAEDAGLPVTVMNAGSWDAAQKAVATGEADLIVGIYRTAEREKYMTYVRPAISQDPSSVVVKSGTQLNYHSWHSLVGKKGLMSEGESYGARFDSYLKNRLTVEQVKGFPAVFEALAAGKGDYGLIGYYAAVTGAPKDKIAIAVTSFASEPMYIAFGEKSACRKLAPAFSKGIRKYLRDGTIDRLWKIGLVDFETAKAK